MLQREEDDLQKGLLLTDNKSNVPILDFDSISNTIVKMIRNSYPNITFGIFGEWGTGKTTLMNSIMKQLLKNKDNIEIVWFDAWKYENEKEFALIPLLKTINYSIKDDNDENKKLLKETLKEAAIFTLGISKDFISSIVSTYAGKKVGDLVDRGLEDINTKLIPQLKEKSISEIDKNSIFYNGIKNIQNAIDKVREKNPEFRIVIFIDDLDRCSEDKVLEILESIKIFLTLNGIIYIVGVSQDKVVELINKKYQTKNGEEYLEKFIQVPITLTEWNTKEIVGLIEDLIKKEVIHPTYSQIIEENKEIIAYAIEENPRKIKRFLNNLIISYETFVTVQKIEKDPEKNIFLKQLFLVQILKSNWKDVYRIIVDSDGKLLSKLKNYIPIEKTKIDKILQSPEIDTQIKGLLEKYKSDERLWHLIDKKNFDALMKIQNWDIFRRALKLTEYTHTLSNSIALNLLKNGKIEEFNKRRANGEFSKLDLSGINLENTNLDNANLDNAKLEGINLRNASLKGANLHEATLESASLTYTKLDFANLSNANLSNADLAYTSLVGTTFSNANLFNVNLSDSIIVETKFDFANLSNANLSNANLQFIEREIYKRYDLIFHADFSKSNLTDVNLSGAKLADTIIINLRSYYGIIVDNETDLSKAIIDVSKFIDDIKEYTSKVPSKISNKRELAERLKQKDFDKKTIDSFLQISKSPE